MDSTRKLRHQPTRQVALALRTPLSGRLDALLALADAADEPTNRAELIAARIYQATEAEPSAQELLRVLTEYRTAPVRAAFIEPFGDDTFLRPARRQGPRGQAPASQSAKTNGRASTDIDPDEPLRDAPLAKLAPAIPEPLEEDLEELVSLADSVGANTSRNELLAALILYTSPVAGDLAKMLRDYKQAPASTKPLGRVIRRRRGRPRRSR